MRLIPAVDDITWQQAAPLLQRALDDAGNTHTPADVRAAIEADEAQLWIGEHSAGVTEVLTYPRCKVLHIWLVAGELNEIARAREALDGFARMAGCKRVSLTGRPGWQRALRGHGYTISGVNLARDLL